MLKKKIQRTNLITRIFKNCDKNLIEFESPSEHGWYPDGNHFEIEFFDGDQFPNDGLEEVASINIMDAGADDIDKDFLFESDEDSEYEEEEAYDEI